MSTPTSHSNVMNSDGMMKQINVFLDKYVLPYPVRYLTNRITILATLCLLIPLIFLTANQAFVNTVNSYLNVMSVVVSSTVLLYSTLSEARDKAAAKRREEIAAANEARMEVRAEADHQAIRLIHEHLDGVNRELLDHVNKSLDTIQILLTERMEKMQQEDHQHITDSHKAIMEGAKAHREELSDLKALVDTLHIKLTSPSNSQPDQFNAS